MHGRYTIARLSAGSGLAIGGHVHGWAFSLLLHAAAVGTTVAAVNELSVLPEQEPFRWEVSLVESSSTEPPAQPTRTPQPSPPEPMPTPVSPEPPRPVVATPVEPEPVVQPVEPVTATAYAAPEPVIERIVADVQPASEPPSEPVPTVAQMEAAPPIVEARAGAPAAIEAPAVPTGSVRADYGWLAEMLWKRVAELKRYPASARLNGWEGRVVVRAVIQMDGHLTNLSVAESSGHETLDQAAMDAVRLACPLKLKHKLFGRSTVVVQVPISYTLTN